MLTGKTINDRCPFNSECERKKCEYVFSENLCDYYCANETDKIYIEDRKVFTDANVDWDSVEDYDFDDERYRQALKLHNSIMVHGAEAANSLMLMCQDLKAMRDEKYYKDLNFETFENYCETKVGIKSRQAYTYISTYEKLGKQVIEEYSSIGITKLALLAEMNPVDRVEVLEKENLSEMSVKELKELREKNTEFAEQIALFAEKEQTAEEEKAALEDRIQELKSELDSLKSQPIEISPKPSDDDIEKIRAEFEAEKQAAVADAVKAEKEKNKKAIEKIQSKAKSDAEKDVAKKIEDAVSKAKEEADTKAAAEIESLKNTITTYKNEVQQLEKAVKASDGATQKVSIYFNAFQENLNNVLKALSDIEDAEQRTKLKTAVNQAITEIINKLRDV